MINENKIKLSIIIPIYNAEMYLARCLDSVMKQNFSNFEIICINDGSTDKSLEILNSYQKLDNRIKIYNQKNQGVAYARNIGINKSKGEYLWFIDADDCINRDDACSTLLNLATEHKLDIIHFKAEVYNSISKTMQPFSYFDNFNDQINYIDLDKKLDFDALKDKFYKLDGALWNKFFRRQFIIDHNIFFDNNLYIGDDALFYLKCLISKPMIMFKNSFFYTYYMNNIHGITYCASNDYDKAKYTINNVYILLELVNRQKDLYIRNGLLCYTLEHIYYWLSKHIDKIELSILFLDVLKILDRDNFEILNNKYYSLICSLLEKNIILQLCRLSTSSHVVSFDLFDTLLVRPYSIPQDVFLHLEERYGLKGFAKDRTDAENKARILLNKKLVNYDEIYACMPQMYQFLKEKEQELEFETLYVNPEMKVIYDYLIKQGKKIILTSDMYYSEDFFKKILDKNNIRGYYKIYISGVVNKSKHHGDLYQYILDDLKIKTSDIIHIGDNYYADYRQAVNNGLQALHYEAPILQFFNSFPRLRKFYDENNNLTSHIIIGVLLKKWLQSNKKMNNYWEYFGYFYGGPICYGLSNFVYDEAIKEGLKEFIFVARDGYIIEKIFNLLQKQFNTNIKTAYVYAPRTLHLQINLETNKEFQWVDKASSLIRLFKDDILDFKNISESNLTQEYKERLINKNIQSLKQITQKVVKSYQNYIQSFDFKEKNIGLFDISAGTFSSMKLLKTFLNDKHIFGYYWTVVGDKYKEIFLYKTYNNEKYFLNNYELSELIITAPELPIKSISDNGDFTRIDNLYEQKRVEIYKIISQEELKFSQDLLNTFGDTKVNFENKTLLNFLNTFISNLDENDRYFFNDVYHGMSEDHVVYRKLFIDDAQKNNLVGDIGAVCIVKNHLSYKLGQEIINAKKFGKKIFLPFRLIKIALMHKKIQWSKKQLENQYPNLKSLPLSCYSDYYEAMKIKNYLSYKLGNLLIKHPFTFIFRVGKVYREWRKEK